MSKKIKIIFLVLVVVVIFVLGYGIVKVVLPNSSISLYGNRLEGAVRIPDARFTKTNELIKESEFVNSVKSYKSGVLIVNIVIDIKKDTNLLSIESMLDKVLELYTEEEKKDYDFQVFVTCKEDTSEDSAYPIIGYKHKTSLSFKWTNNS